MIKKVYGLIPNRLKIFMRQGMYRWKISKKLSPYIPKAICIDVGASYYPHTNWFFFLNAPKVNWFVVEPNAENLGYTKKWNWACKLEVCTKGLSSEGGNQTLYVTNVDSGSSLLKPKIPALMEHRFIDIDYYFPVREVNIETIKLEDVISNYVEKCPIFIKLDTQGTELSILRGADRLFSQNLILGIEMESTMLADPIMTGSEKFWEASQFLESKGFELLHIKPIYAPLAKNSPPKCRTYLTECDAIFTLRWDVVCSLPIEFRVALMAFYLTNYLYYEVISILDKDLEVRTYLLDAGCDLDNLMHSLQRKV